MNKLPLISVIVPIYKSEKYLPGCISSIITQSFKDLEIKGGISFSNTEGNISLKRVNNNQKLIYIEDFEIIDNEFATFLSSKFAFKVNLMILPIIILISISKVNLMALR